MKPKTFSLQSRQGIEWLECALFAARAPIIHAFTTRRAPRAGAESSDFSFALSPGFEARRFKQRLRRLARAVGADEFQTALLKQIHSSSIFRVERTTHLRLQYVPAGTKGPVRTAQWPAADALITNEPEILLCIRTADCMPILIADPRRRAIAAVHAGWRGTLARIVEKTVDEMRQQFGSCAEDLVVAIGPSIRACCYEVGKEVLQAFADEFLDSHKFFRAPSRKSGATETHLDLIAIARRQLRLAGVDDSKIFVADYCTACRTDLFYSYRMEGNRAGRMMALIGMWPDKNG